MAAPGGSCRPGLKDKFFTFSGSKLVSFLTAPFEVFKVRFRPTTYEIRPWFSQFPPTSRPRGFLDFTKNRRAPTQQATLWPLSGSVRRAQFGAIWWEEGCGNGPGEEGWERCATVQVIYTCASHGSTCQPDTGLDTGKQTVDIRPPHTQTHNVATLPKSINVNQSLYHFCLKSRCFGQITFTPSG